MIKEIKLPEIAENVDTATVIKLLVSEGDTVEKDQNIAELESDKAAFELPSDFDGKVKSIEVSEGDEVKVGQVVLTIETGDGDEGEEQGREEEKESEEEKKSEEGEKKEEKKSEEGEEEEEKKGEDEKGEDEKKGEEEKKDEEEEEGEEEKKSEEGEEEEEKREREEEKEKEKKSEEEKVKRREGAEDVPASPSVRRLARELGVDIRKVEGTGPFDRVSAEDVKSYAKEIVRSSEHEFAEQYELPDFSKFGEVERKPMDNIRKRIARNMAASWQTIPHVFHFDKADVTELERFRKKYSKEAEKQDSKLTVTAILVKIMARALQVFPKFNASIDMKQGEVVYKKYYHIGIAVDTDRGLLVPVIRDANQKTILELSVELGEIAKKAREKKIKPDELQGANIAISNLGGIGGTGFTPIVYQPNVAVMGVARTVTEPVHVDGEFEPRMMLPLTLSYDHRLIDGAEAARFLRWFCEALENPLLTMFK